MNPKRWLFLIHRWLGVAMCLVFLLWFASGLVMMYVQYPELTERERLAHLPELDPRTLRVGPGEAMRTAGVEQVTALRLSSSAGRPVWQLRDHWGKQHQVFADDGTLLDSVDSARALESVLASGFMSPVADPVHGERVDMDQWTISASLNPHRPLHRIHLRDPAGTVLYVSGRTGEIVRDTDRRERLWNWVGSTIHWIYPMALRRHAGLWAQLIIWLSVAGLISILSGLIIGIMRLRLRRRYRNDSVSPYIGWDKWHHIGGLLAVVFVTTFTFSGLMSMSPWGLFSSTGDYAAQVQGYRGGAVLELAAFPAWQPQALPAGVREVEWQPVGGQGHLVLSRSRDERLVLMRESEPERRPAALRARIAAGAPNLIPGAVIRAHEMLEAYDNYYYSHHDSDRPLPVYRVTFDDAESSVFHIDLNTGAVVSRQTDGSRLGRWLFNGLHSLDFQFLLSRGFLWDLVMILLSLAGLSFSATAVVVGWRRLRRSLG